MSTSDSSTPPLTRRQLRELRNTGATPVITPDMAQGDASSAEPSAPVDAPAEPTSAADEPGSVDALDAPEQEAPSDEDASTPEDASSEDAPTSKDASSEDAGADAGEGSDSAEVTDSSADSADSAVADDVDASADADGPADSDASDDAPISDVPTDDSVEPVAPPARPAAPVSFAPPMTDAGLDLGVGGLTRRQVRAQEKIRTASIPVITPDFDPAPATAVHPVAAERVEASTSPAIFKPAVADDTDETPVAAESERDEAPVAVVNPSLGSELLEGATPEVTLPPSFDQLIARSASATGSISTPNALILSQTPTGAPLVAPVTATGEVLITGTFDLPEGLGSIGHAPGTTDGRDVDAVLLDGELPPASSPTPIAASAAISTVKQPGEIIRPPAPEKGSRLMIGLIITTGALAALVAGALILAFTTGVF